MIIYWCQEKETQKQEVNEMKSYRWAVVEGGTWRRVNWEGYKTKKEAIRVAEEFIKVTGKNYVVVDEKNKSK